MSVTATGPDTIAATRAAGRAGALVTAIRRNPTAITGAVILLGMIAVAVFAGWLGTTDPKAIAPIARLKPPSSEHWFGTDMLGRDIYSRVIYGSRVSLTVGLSVALISLAIGLAIGLVAGISRGVDAIVMRVLDGFMAIPSVLLAIALMALTGASLYNVIIAIAISEIPRVTRLVRSVVLGVRQEIFIEAAIASGARIPRLLWRHILPNTVAPLIVQGTYICASAMLLEAALSFIGAGTSPEVPSWGNIMAEGRSYFQLAPHIILFPGLFLSLVVLAVNLVGDGLRDALDPRLSRRV